MSIIFSDTFCSPFESGNCQLSAQWFWYTDESSQILLRGGDQKDRFWKEGKKKKLGSYRKKEKNWTSGYQMLWLGLKCVWWCKGQSQLGCENRRHTLVTKTNLIAVAAAVAKSRQSCPTLCDPTDGSPAGSSVPGILQARILEWVAISFSKFNCSCLKWVSTHLSSWC